MAAMECDKGFSCSYMLLKPEELTFSDLIKILVSSDLEKRKFVDSSEGREESFRHRWLIFISIVAQKVLQFISKPMSLTGSAIEIWLNLLSSNHGFVRLLINRIQGKKIDPDKNSANFVSFTGNMDMRMELENSIKHDDPKYIVALSMMASKASYENEAYIETTVTQHWKMEYLGFFNCWNDYHEKATTQVFLLCDNTDDRDTIVVSFRGTETFDADAWCTDFDISWYELPNAGKIHGGFMKALGLQKNVGWPKELKGDGLKRPVPLAYYHIREILRDRLSQNEHAKFVVTGHSLGGALAILFPAVLFFHEEKMLLERLEGVYTFGQPRVGDLKFAQFMEKQLEAHNIRYFRLVYGNDIIPRLPYDDKDFMFKHFGKCVYYNRKYEAKVVPEEPNKNYFSPLKTIPMMTNAFMELIRSFTMGPEYREGWLLRVLRIIGLLFPGVPAHCPPDYVNAARLGPSDVFKPPHDKTQKLLGSS